MAARAGSLGFKLYVGNLPWTIANRQLKEYFSQFGYVSKSVVVFDKNTGMSKGFGFVTFSSEKSVSAVNNKPNHMLDGQTFNVAPVDAHHQIE